MLKISFLSIVFFVAALSFTSCTFTNSGNSEALFTKISPGTSGIDFRNDLTEFPNFNIINYEYFFNGGGVAIGDINNDGLDDIYFTANMLPNKLYLNKGNLAFEDITEKAGVAGKKGWKTGVTMADVNGDGLLDIYVCHSGNNKDYLSNELFINNGNQTFTESAKLFGLDKPGYSTQASFFDYDNDHDLDLFLLNHSILAPTDRLLEQTNPLRTLEDPLTGDKLYRNDGNTFTDVTKQAGISSLSIGFGLGVAVGDIDNDGWMDIYVSNDYYERDYYYHNNADGTFQEKLQSCFQHVSRNSMGSDVADFNNDGNLDLVTVDMRPADNYRLKTVQGNYDHVYYGLNFNRGYHRQFSQNALQLNRGNDQFSEIAFLANVASSDWSWGPLLADFDNDGNKDIFITNGIGRDFTNLDFINYDASQLINQKTVDGNQVDLFPILEKIKEVKVPNNAFKNNADLTFSDVTKDWGLSEPSLSNGAAYADLDNDGDLDLVVNNINEKAFLYRNNSTKSHFLKIKLIGAGKNKNGVGARVAIETKDGNQLIENIATRGFQSSVSHILHVGLGNQTEIEKLTVTWPGGHQQLLRNISANTQLELDEKNATPPQNTTPNSAREADLFQDVTARFALGYEHKENPFEDLNHDRLIPYRLSNSGPHLSVADVNGDGLQDFFIGGASGYPAMLYIQKNNTFYQQKDALWEQEKGYEDLGSAFFDADNDGDLDLYVVSGGNEFNESDEHYQDRLYLNNGKGSFAKSKEALPKMLVSGSCVTPCDFDQDGDTDLFVGGRVVPRKYGLPAQSFLLENDGKGNFKDVTNDRAPGLSNVGMVTDAVWSDIDKDGLKDLIVVGDWMPVSVFKNHKSKFENSTEQLGLAESGGLWNTIKAMDLDKDGDDDYVLGNFGQNAVFRASTQEPMNLYTADFDQNNSFETIISYFIKHEEVPLPTRDELFTQLTVKHKKYKRYEDYANEKMKDVFTKEELSKAHKATVNQLSSAIITNEGTRLSLKALPQLAQFSPNYAVVVDDFSKDGTPDVLLAGNTDDLKPILGRCDAGTGTLLLGDKGYNQPSPIISRGLMLNGIVRDIEQIRLKNGEKLLLVGQNKAPLKIYKCLF